MRQRAMSGATGQGGGKGRLPALPSPFQRMRRHCGVYPLVQPTSILRRPHSHSTRLSEFSAASANNHARTMQVLEEYGSSVAENTTSASSSQSSSGSNISGTSSNSSINSAQRIDGGGKAVVQFDPRVTVTELADDGVHRVWYSDSDLERFKCETVVAAKLYLQDHPDQVVVYSKSYMDPVTKTLRKRALFSMPALCDVTLEDDDTDATDVSDEDVMAMQRLQELQQQLLSSLAFGPGLDDDAYRNVKRILIVDRNPWILDLFQRSLATMFGDARIECVQTAEAALELVARTPFAIVIAEQLIDAPCRPVAAVLDPAATATSAVASPSSPSTVADDGGGGGAAAAIPQGPKRMTGSDLFGKLNGPARKGLLIGVSMRAGDTALLTAAGADFVWGKPPPRMDRAMKAALVQALHAKQQLPQQA